MTNKPINIGSLFVSKKHSCLYASSDCYDVCFALKGEIFMHCKQYRFEDKKQAFPIIELYDLKRNKHVYSPFEHSWFELYFQKLL